VAAGKNMTMKVDSGTPRTIINDGEHQFMDLEEPLYLGGLPASVKDSAFKKWHIRNTVSFNGILIQRTISECNFSLLIQRLRVTDVAL
jgi:Laminin G domain